MIKIEEFGDINSDYPYLEVFLKDSINPFLEVAISENKELSFKIYSSTIDIQLNIEEWQFILSKAETFMAQALKNEDDFLNFTDQ
ncbi:hypothetical protein [uncultured Chryseobacterium sp.]|uniref:hypothetical protein n=1 Tax=uncultured Chryseobacterium sp. TaxID=259322 RepID=UPI002587BDBC|nr:hypothetical protein [uncultured Chryseobacterium sp.]